MVGRILRTILMVSVLVGSVSVRVLAQDPYEGMRERWLEAAEAAKPELKYQTVTPVAVVEPVKDPVAFQGWRYDRVGAPDSFYAKNFKEVETITLDKETARVKQYLSIKFADIVYNGQWFTPLREAMSAFVTETQKTVTGDVKLKLYKGNIINAGVTSPYTLYDEEVATFDEDNVYNQADSAGFINLFGLPIKVRAKLEQKRNNNK